MDDLRAQKPELADQIHVFSSFFYKKLSTKKSVLFQIYRLCFYLLRHVTARRTAFKVFENGHPNLICLKRNTSLCLLTSSELFLVSRNVILIVSFLVFIGISS